MEGWHIGVFVGGGVVLKRGWVGFGETCCSGVSQTWMASKQRRRFRIH